MGSFFCYPRGAIVVIITTFSITIDITRAPVVVVRRRHGRRQRRQGRHMVAQQPFQSRACLSIGDSSKPTLRSSMALYSASITCSYTSYGDTGKLKSMVLLPIGGIRAFLFILLRVLPITEGNLCPWVRHLK